MSDLSPGSVLPAQSQALQPGIENQMEPRPRAEMTHYRSAGLRIPTHRGQAFRFDRGHHSDLKPATIPT
jgi:hypothetical protein